MRFLLYFYVGDLEIDENDFPKNYEKFPVFLIILKKKKINFTNNKRYFYSPECKIHTVLGPSADLNCLFFYKVSLEHSREKPAPKKARTEGQNKISEILIKFNKN